MRKLVAAILAVPVIATAYLPRSLRRPATPTLIVAGLPIMLVALSGVRAFLAPAAVGSEGGVLGIVATAPPSFSDVVAAPAPGGLSANVAPPVGPASGATASDASAATGSSGGTPNGGLQAATTSNASGSGGTDRSSGSGGTDRSAGSANGSTGGTSSVAGARPGAPRPGGAVSPTSGVPPPPAPAAPPVVVRFRPLAGTSDVPTSADLSVRFTEPMDRAATEGAFRATVNGKAIAGTFRWFEESTVLLLDPKASLPPGAKVSLAVGKGARSAAGKALAKTKSASFTVAKRAVTTTTKIPKPVSASFHDAELWVLELMNCTRTGGTVLRSGDCRGGGTRKVRPLRFDEGIAAKVARPYATLLASRRLCHHFYDGNPGVRLRRAGFTNWDWAENVGACGSNSLTYSLLSTHLYFQSEKSYNGGHYRNMMNAKYDRVGIGIVKVRGVLRMVVNFYHP